jgi:ribonuclease D
VPHSIQNSPRPIAPSKDDSALLPPFVGLSLDQIEVPVSESDAARAVEYLSSHRFVGFDTESKPTFHKGEASTGPHVVQFSTLDRGFIFQVHRSEHRDALQALLQSTKIVKVGFGLKSDRGQMQRKFGVPACALLDLTTYFKQLGHRNEVGVRSAVAMVMQQRFQKSKRVSTTNWSNAELSDAQLLYAANDAHGAIRVLLALNVDERVLPITGLDATES